MLFWAKEIFCATYRSWKRYIKSNLKTKWWQIPFMILDTITIPIKIVVITWMWATPKGQLKLKKFVEWYKNVKKED